MTQPTLRADPAEIPSTLKEAVVDSLLNLTYAQLSGQGGTGQYLFGARPRILLNSGFLLPQRSPSGDDEVTSPIWVSSHGLQMQLNAAETSVMTVFPRLCVYVRVLPHEEDLKRPNCRPVFMLRQAVVDEIRTARNRRLDEEWDKVKGAYTSKWRHPDWAATRVKVVDEVYSAKGIPRHLLTSEFPQDASETNEPSGEADDLGNGTREGVPVKAGETLPIKDEHFEPLAVPHKWMRLEVELPSLELDTSKSKEAIQRDIENHATLMNAVVAKRLQDWAESDDPDMGGKAWGYRHQLTIPASQYTKWADFLDMARKSQLRISLPQIQLNWNLELHTDWLDPYRRSCFLALENTSNMPSQHVDETEEAVFLVSLRVELPIALHHALKLERIDPSYRYNKYLAHPAMGHNGGVVQVQSDPSIRVLETTWTPRYAQPRIIPTSANGVECRVRLLSQPDGLDSLAPLVPAMQEWLDGLPAQVNPAEGLAPSDTAGVAREEEAFTLDLQKWASEMKALAAGLKCLEESRVAWCARGVQAASKAIVYEAWLAMNETMADFMKTRFGDDNNEWRLFQLAFIIANIPALASRIPEFAHHYDERRDDAVTLLYLGFGEQWNQKPT